MAITIEISLVITTESSDVLSTVASNVLGAIATTGYRLEKFQCSPFMVVETRDRRPSPIWTSKLKKEQMEACKALINFSESLGMLTSKALADELGINKGQFSQIISARVRISRSILEKILYWLNEQNPKPVEVIETFQSLWQQSKGGAVCQRISS